MVRGESKGWGSLLSSCMVLSYSIPASPRMTGKLFLPNPFPLGPRETPPHLVKLYFLLICPQLLKPVSFKKKKKKLKITNKFIQSNQTNF